MLIPLLKSMMANQPKSFVLTKNWCFTCGRALVKMSATFISMVTCGRGMGLSSKAFGCSDRICSNLNCTCVVRMKRSNMLLRNTDFIKCRNQMISEKQMTWIYIQLPWRICKHFFLHFQEIMALPKCTHHLVVERQVLRHPVQSASQ